MLAFVTIFLSFCAIGNSKWKPDPPVDTSEETFSTHPLVIHARKMAKLVPHQDTITTCRYILFKVPKTFHEAEQVCESLEWVITHRGKPSLATIQNADENLNVRTMIRLAFGIHHNHSIPYHQAQWAFIGLSKRINNSRPLLDEEKGVFNADEWYYQDNQKANYSNWHRGMPDQQYKGFKKRRQFQNWVQVNKEGYWDDTYSTQERPFVCQYCGRYVVFSMHTTWKHAKFYCEDLGLHFATVNSQEENDELMYAANKTLGTEIYGRRFNNSNWVWIGEMRNNVTGGWEHYDGTPLEYHPHWDYKYQPDERVGVHGKQSVVAVSRINGKWDDSFSAKKRPFACMCPRDTCLSD